MRDDLLKQPDLDPEKMSEEQLSFLRNRDYDKFYFETLVDANDLSQREQILLQNDENKLRMLQKDEVVKKRIQTKRDAMYSSKLDEFLLNQSKTIDSKVKDSLE